MFGIDFVMVKCGDYITTSSIFEHVSTIIAMGLVFSLLQCILNMCNVCMFIHAWLMVPLLCHITTGTACSVLTYCVWLHIGCVFSLP